MQLFDEDVVSKLAAIFAKTNGIEKLSPLVRVLVFAPLPVPDAEFSRNEETSKNLFCLVVPALPSLSVGAGRLWVWIGKVLLPLLLCHCVCVVRALPY